VADTIFCVDDDRNLCQIIAKALGEEGHRVLTAFDGDEALSVVAEVAPDVVLLDLILPRRDGFAVIEAIRGLDGPAAATRIIILSGCSPTPEYLERAASLDVSEFLTKPVPLVRLLEVVASALQEAKRGVPVAERKEAPVAQGRGDPPLKGSLQRVPFPALLHHLHGLRATGVLHLERDKKRKWIELRDGHPVAVRSNLLNECLGHYLVRTGRIHQADLDESRRRMKNGRLQGEILVAMEILSEEEITAALRAQADEKLFEVFAWDDGTFRFEKGVGLERANAIGVERSPANLILHGVRERFSGERIQEFFHSHADCVVAPGDSPYYRFQEIDLEGDQESLLRELDGTRRVSEILAGDRNQSLGRTLYALVATGLLTLRDGSVPRARSEVPQRAVRTVTTPEQSESECASLTAMVERFSAQTYFEILGITPSAPASEVEKAYVTLAEDTHPDRYSGSSEAVRKVAEEVFAHITRAYETLGDPRRRGEYVLDQRREQREAAKEEAGRRALEAANQFQRGEALLKSRAYEDALVHFGQALELDPQEGDYHTHYGWTLHLCHPSNAPMIEEAMEHVRRGLKLASHGDRAYLYMGRLFRAIGKPAAAEKMFTRAVQIQPDCVEALRELRLINLRRERSKGLIRRVLRR
jgi:CheY-like chemotaxis protein/tetratricopeptide (TPR) repeat protein